MADDQTNPVAGCWRHQVSINGMVYMRGPPRRLRQVAAAWLHRMELESVLSYFKTGRGSGVGADEFHGVGRSSCVSDPLIAPRSWRIVGSPLAIEAGLPPILGLFEVA